MSTDDPIIPDRESILAANARRTRPFESLSKSELADEYRWCQADTLLRLAKADSMEELHRMAKAGLLDDLIHEHNRKMQANQGEKQ